uniref:Uncharacterized protein n=1 Tax=Romanomermis culicivorax TaxID=13658 RepID=A0A915IBU8_ROMCU
MVQKTNLRLKYAVRPLLDGKIENLRGMNDDNRDHLDYGMVSVDHCNNHPFLQSPKIRRWTTSETSSQHAAPTAVTAPRWAALITIGCVFTTLHGRAVRAGDVGRFWTLNTNENMMEKVDMLNAAPELVRLWEDYIKIHSNKQVVFLRVNELQSTSLSASISWYSDQKVSINSATLPISTIFSSVSSNPYLPKFVANHGSNLPTLTTRLTL